MDNNFKFTNSVVALPLFFVLSLWIIFWCEAEYHYNFYDNGIYPRTLSGLQGIFLSPFIHGNLEHLANNSIPLLLLLAALRYFYRKQSYQIIVFGILFSGLITWIIGRQNYHIGASSLIYVLVSFIFFKGLQTKFYRLVALSFTILLLYGGMVWYIFPHPEISESISISWEGHLAGFITGIAFSVLYKTPEFNEPIFYDWQKQDFNPDEDDFMSCFDENGNFVPKQSNIEDSDQEFLIAPKPEQQYIYHYKHKDE